MNCHCSGAALIITDAVVTDYLKRIKTTCSEIKEQLNEILSGREVIIWPRIFQFHMFKSVETTYHKYTKLKDSGQIICEVLL